VSFFDGDLAGAGHQWITLLAPIADFSNVESSKGKRAIVGWRAAINEMAEAAQSPS
jgi:hypothetical protein